jgi:hypothetical protein
MANANRASKNKGGRPKTTGTGTLIGVRCQTEFLERVDTWRSDEPDSPSRPEAIRKLADIGLKVSKGSRRSRAGS